MAKTKQPFLFHSRRPLSPSENMVEPSRGSFSLQLGAIYAHLASSRAQTLPLPTGFPSSSPRRWEPSPRRRRRPNLEPARAPLLRRTPAPLPAWASPTGSNRRHGDE
jgi:hypothetical protein